MDLSDAVKRYAGKKVGVLMGGMSSERSISLRSGANVYNSLKKIGLNAVQIDIGKDAAGQIQAEKIDIAFIALHGRYGEDGCVQGMLELMGIPYTGPGVLGSAIGMNKLVTKKLLRENGIPVPASAKIDFENIDSTVSDIENRLGFPAVLKANCEGSSVGVRIIPDAKAFRAAMPECRRDFPDSFVEQYVKGREITVGLVGESDGGVRVLPILELRPQNEFYDFEAKYTKGKTSFDIPARIAKNKEEKIVSYVRTAYKSLHQSGVIRIDAMLDAEENPYFLEINTIPGLTDTSDIPAMAQAAGMTFEELAVMVLDLAAGKGPAS